MRKRYIDKWRGQSEREKMEKEIEGQGENDIETELPGFTPLNHCPHRSFFSKPNVSALIDRCFPVGNKMSQSEFCRRDKGWRRQLPVPKLEK